jgi:hypothetical protein
LDVIPVYFLSSAMFAGVLALVVWALAVRLTGDRRVATIATILVCAGGGLGWIRLVGDLLAGTGSGIDLVSSNPYDNTWADGWPYFKIASIFGSRFAAAVDTVQPGSWQGPIESGLGWHLVFVTSAMPGRVPAFNEVEPDIKAGWIDDQRAAARRRAFEAMRTHYEIHLPDMTQVAAATHKPKPKETP